MELFFKNQFKNLEKNNIFDLHHSFFQKFILPHLEDTTYDSSIYFIFSFIISMSLLVGTYCLIGKYSFFFPIFLFIILPIYTSYFSSYKVYEKHTTQKMNKKIKIIKFNQNFTIQKIKSYLDFLNESYDSPFLKNFLIILSKNSLTEEEKKSLIRYIDNLECCVQKNIENQIHEENYQKILNQHFSKNNMNHQEKEFDFFK